MAKKRGKSKRTRRLAAPDFSFPKWLQAENLPEAIKTFNRSEGAKKGWRKRRKEERKRARAARRGWATRRRNAGKRQRKAALVLHQYLVSVKYTNKSGRFKRLDYLVNSESVSEALGMVRAEMRLTREGFSRWRKNVTENPDAHPRKKSIEIN